MTEPSLMGLLPALAPYEREARGGGRGSGIFLGGGADQRDGTRRVAVRWLRWTRRGRKTGNVVPAFSKPP